MSGAGQRGTRNCAEESRPARRKDRREGGDENIVRKAKAYFQKKSTTLLQEGEGTKR
jgi:hypothetical protein